MPTSGNLGRLLGETDIHVAFPQIESKETSINPAKGAPGRDSPFDLSPLSFLIHLSFLPRFITQSGSHGLQRTELCLLVIVICGLHYLLNGSMTRVRIKEEICTLYQDLKTDNLFQVSCPACSLLMISLPV